MVGVAVGGSVAVAVGMDVNVGVKDEVGVGTVVAVGEGRTVGVAAAVGVYATDVGDGVFFLGFAWEGAGLRSIRAGKSSARKRNLEIYGPPCRILSDFTASPIKNSPPRCFTGPERHQPE